MSYQSKAPSILFVDDNAEILRAITRKLRAHNLELRTVTSAQAALQILDNHRIDVIVVDEHMPGMTGSELLEEMAGKYASTARIMLTGNPTLPLLSRLINQHTVHRLLTKPCDTVELCSAIGSALREVGVTGTSAETFGNNESARQLERSFPGITHVARSVDGAVLLSNGTFDVGFDKEGEETEDK